MRRLVADAFVHVRASNLDLFLLRDAVQDKVGFEPLRGDPAGHPDELFLLFFQHLVRHTAFAVTLYQFGQSVARFVFQKRWREFEVHPFA